MKGAVFDTEEWPSDFTQIFNGQPDDRAQEQHRVYDHTAMPKGSGVLGVQVERTPGTHRRREKDVVGLGDRATPVVREYLPDGEVLE